MSKTWRLTNSSGGTEFTAGDMDISLVNGSVVEITEPEQILDQRMRKAAVDEQGSNKLALWWGSLFKKTLGVKNLTEEVMRSLGNSMQLLLNGLITSQAEVARRVPLAPAEQIQAVDKMVVTTRGTLVDVVCQVSTKAGTSVPVSMPGVANAV